MLRPHVRIAGCAPWTHVSPPRPHGLEDLPGENGERRTLKFLVRHVARHDPIVLSHAFDHEVLDEAANAHLEPVERIGERRPYHDIAVASFFLDLIEEDTVFLRELRPEALVQDLDDLREGRLLVLRLPGAGFGRGLDVLRFAVRYIDGTRVHARQPIVLKRHLVAHPDHRVVAIDRQVGQRKRPKL